MRNLCLARGGKECKVSCSVAYVSWVIAVEVEKIGVILVGVIDVVISSFMEALAMKVRKAKRISLFSP